MAENIKRRKEVLDTILAEFEEFGITCKPDIPKDYTLVNFRVLTTGNSKLQEYLCTKI